MKLSDIRQHLRPYSIVQRRKTTVNHAFASALAPCDNYDEPRFVRAMALLSQDDLDNLRCVYCSRAAQTWDHLIGLVKDSQWSGFGHQIGNLVPCCKDCNSQKGNKDWRAFLRTRVADAAECAKTEEALAHCLTTFSCEVDLGRLQAERPAEWQRYQEIKRRIIELMAEADQLAGQLRLQATKCPA
jgi:hypothetical protein